MRRKLAAGNWKMNGTAADLAEVAALRQGLPEGADAPSAWAEHIGPPCGLRRIPILFVRVAER